MVLLNSILETLRNGGFTKYCLEVIYVPTYKTGCNKALQPRAFNRWSINPPLSQGKL